MGTTGKRDGQTDGRTDRRTYKLKTTTLGSFKPQCGEYASQGWTPKQEFYTNAISVFGSSLKRIGACISALDGEHLRTSQY